MTIRPVDLQTMIPKLPELQKAKSVETESERNNFNINIHKEQQRQDKSTKQVVGTKKTNQARIDREKQNKNRQRKQEKNQKDGQEKDSDGHDKKFKGKCLAKIDIRI